MNIKLEDLEINNYMIYQDKDSFNFGFDAVLLANFALKNMKKENAASEIKICDLCAGNIPIPLIMYAKRKEFLSENVKFTAFEIDEGQVELSKKTIDYNARYVEGSHSSPVREKVEGSHSSLVQERVDDSSIQKTVDGMPIQDAINIIQDDINNIYIEREKYKKYYEYFDAVTCNPPYMKKGSGIVNETDSKIIARHEVLVTFEQICKVASLILKSNKKFFIINHSDRFTELCETLKKYLFEVKKAQFIYPHIDKPSNLVLIEAVKNANAGLKVLEPVISCA